MNEVRDIIKQKTWNDFKNDFMSLFAQATAFTAQDNEAELSKILREIDIVAAAYRYSKNTEKEERNVNEEFKNKTDITNETQTKEESIISEIAEIEETGEPEEKVYAGEDIQDILSNEIKQQQEKEQLIPVKEVPLYTFKIYDGTKYTIPDEEIINNAKVVIPSNDGYDYYMRVIVAADNVLYTEKKEFQKEFSYIKAAYIRTVADPDEDKIEINKMLDSQIDLSLLESEGRIVQWINNNYVSSARPKSEETIRLEGNRQRLFDNKNIRFMYDEKSDIYHDKSCAHIKLIDLKELRGSENPPKDKKPCSECLMDMYIRKGCIDDFKNQALYKHFFIKGDVSLDTIKEFLGNQNATFRIESVNKIKITCNEDTWKIETDGRGNFIRLWHNNYFVDKRGKRHIDDREFHEQQSDMIMNVQMAMQYIMDYSYSRTHA